MSEETSPVEPSVDDPDLGETSPALDDPAEVTKPLWRRPAAIVVASVVVAGLLVTGGIFLFHPASANATACSLYEDAYNQMADSVFGLNHDLPGASRDRVLAEMTLAPDRMQDAFDKASGKVAVQIRSSQEIASVYASDQSSKDLGLAFFMSTADVAKACEADGAKITLNEMK